MQDNKPKHGDKVNTSPRRRRWWLWLTAGAFAIVLIYGISLVTSAYDRVLRPPETRQGLDCNQRLEIYPARASYISQDEIIDAYGNKQDIATFHLSHYIYTLGVPNRFEGIDFNGADLSNIPQISTSEISTSESISPEISPFSQIQLYCADFSDTNLTSVSLSRSELRESDFSRANLTGANFEQADLRGTNMRDVVAIGANFTIANMESTDLRGANLQGANLKYATLWGANLAGADLRGVDLSETGLNGAYLVGGQFSDPVLSLAAFIQSIIGTTTD